MTPSDTPNVRPMQERERRIAAQLEVYAIRCTEIFARVFDGKILLVDAADLCFDAATASGLADEIGHDQLQKLLATCIATASKEGDQRR